MKPAGLCCSLILNNALKPNHCKKYLATRKRWGLAKEVQKSQSHFLAMTRARNYWHLWN